MSGRTSSARTLRDDLDAVHTHKSTQTTYSTVLHTVCGNEYLDAVGKERCSSRDCRHSSNVCRSL